MLSFENHDGSHQIGDVRLCRMLSYNGFAKVDILYQENYIGTIMIGYYGNDTPDLCLHDRDGERFMFSYMPGSTENVNNFHYIGNGYRFDEDIIIDVSDECDLFQKNTISDFDSVIAIEIIQYYNELRSQMTDMFGTVDDICLNIHVIDNVRVFVDSIRSYNDSRSTEGL